jgi:hypothetical protein
MISTWKKTNFDQKCFKIWLKMEKLGLVQKNYFVSTLNEVSKYNLILWASLIVETQSKQTKVSKETKIRFVSNSFIKDFDLKFSFQLHYKQVSNLNGLTLLYVAFKRCLCLLVLSLNWYWKIINFNSKQKGNKAHFQKICILLVKKILPKMVTFLLETILKVYPRQYF